MEPSSLSYFEYRLSVIIRNFTTLSDYSIIHHNVMDRFLKKRTATDSDPSSSSPHKKRKIPVSAKQGDISAAWRAQEFGSHFYESGGNCSVSPAIQLWTTLGNQSSSNTLSLRWSKVGDNTRSRCKG